MPDNVYKSDEIQDEGSGVTISDLGPEEEFAKDVLKSLKERISEARSTIKDLEKEIDEKQRQAQNEKQQILDEAENKAQKIKQDAQEEAQEIIESKQSEIDGAREEGYEDGYADGQDQARKDMAEKVEQAEQILHEAKRKREAYLDNNFDELVGLAGELAKKIVREHVEIDRETIQRVVESALDEVSDIRDVTIVLNPMDAEVIADLKDRYVEDHPSLQEISLSEDANMQRGGCRIRTEFGDVQATLDGQIEHLTETFLEQQPDALSSSEESSEENDDA